MLKWKKSMKEFGILEISISICSFRSTCKYAWNDGYYPEFRINEEVVEVIAKKTGNEDGQGLLPSLFKCIQICHGSRKKYFESFD